MTNTGLSLLKTWLNAVNIPFLSDADEGSVVAQNAAGDTIHILVGKGLPPTPNSIVVEGSDLTGGKVSKALETFTHLQEQLGYEPKAPVDRGPLPTKKLANGSDFELVALRHGEMRRCPNPPKGKLESYKPTIERAIWRFMRSNSTLCADNLLAIEDLRTYAQVWTVNYCALYELDRGQDDQAENAKLLFTHLAQRFSNFRQLLIDKSRNVHPMLDTAFIGLHGRPYDYSNFSSWESTDAAVEAEDEANKPKRRRRNKSAVKLDDALGALGHDQMVTVLAVAAKNDRIHPDARAEAMRRLDAHKAECKECTEVDFKDENADPEALPSFYSVKVDLDDDEG